MSLARKAAAAAALLLAAAGMLLAEGAWIAAALGLAAWVLAGTAASAPEPLLEATRRLSTSFLEPGPEAERIVEVEVELRNLGPRLELLELADRLPPGGSVAEGSNAWKGSLDAGATATISYGLRLGRGLHRFDQVEARALDPFHALESRLALPCPGLVVAPPALAGGARAAFTAPSARAFSGLSRARRTGAGTDFAGTRQYGPGDSLRSLNWRAQARWGEEIVNVFEEERAIDVGLVLDCRAQAYDDQALFDSAVSAAATLAETLLDGGHRVAFLNYGSTIEWTPPGSGRTQRLRLRSAAAGAALGSHVAFERFDNVPVYLFPPRSLILLASPLLPDDAGPLRSLVALGYAVAVLRPGRPASRDETTEGAIAARMRAMEDEITATRLLRAGIEVWAWEAGTPLGAARPLGATGAAARSLRGRRRTA